MSYVIRKCEFITLERTDTVSENKEKYQKEEKVQNKTNMGFTKVIKKQKKSREKSNEMNEDTYILSSTK